MRFGFGDEEYEYDGVLSVEDAMQLYKNSEGLGINEIDRAIVQGNPYALAAFLYLLKRRAGEATTWKDVLKLDIRQWKGPLADAAAVPVEDEDGGEAPAAKPDPTDSGTGRPRKRATSST